MGNILIDPTEGFDPFLEHPAAGFFLQTAKSLVGSTVEPSLVVAEIVDHGRAVAIEHGIRMSDSEAHALGYLARNRAERRDE